jgi:hypothetical protein
MGLFGATSIKSEGMMAQNRHTDRRLGICSKTYQFTALSVDCLVINAF